MGEIKGKKGGEQAVGDRGFAGCPVPTLPNPPRHRPFQTNSVIFRAVCVSLSGAHGGVERRRAGTALGEARVAPPP